MATTAAAGTTTASSNTPRAVTAATTAPTASTAASTTVGTALNPIHYPLVILFDRSTLPAAHQASINSLYSSLTSAADIIILSRDELAQSKPGSKKKINTVNNNNTAANTNTGNTATSNSNETTASKRSKQQQSNLINDDINSSTLDDQLIDSLCDRIELELQSHNESIAEKRKLELEALDPNAAAATAAINTKGNKSSKSNKTAVTDKSAAVASTSTAVSAEQKGSNKQQRGTSAKANTTVTATITPNPADIDANRAAAHDRLLSNYNSSTELPLFILLVDVVQRAADVSRLSTAGINLNSITVFNDSNSVTIIPPVQNSAYELEKEEFAYDQYDRQIKSLYKPDNNTNIDTDKNNSNEIIERSIALIHPFDRAYSAARTNSNSNSNNNIIELPSTAAPYLRDITAAIQQAIKSNNNNNNPSVFRDLVILTITIPAPATTPALGIPVNISSNSAIDGTASPTPNSNNTAASRAKSPKTTTAATTTTAAATTTATSSNKKSSSTSVSSIASKKSDFESELTRLSVEFQLQLREFASISKDFIDWRSSANIYTLPTVNPTSNTVDNRLYNHLLNKLSPETIDINTICYALFQQVANTAGNNNSTNEFNNLLQQEQLNSIEQTFNQQCQLFDNNNTINSTNNSNNSSNNSIKGVAHIWLSDHCIHCGLSYSVYKLQSTGEFCSATVGLDPTILTLAANNNNQRLLNTVLIPAADEISIRQSLAKLNPLFTQQTCNDSDYILKQSLLLQYNYSILPGINRCGMPSKSESLTNNIRSAELNSLYNSNSNISIDIINRTLLSLEFDLMLKSNNKQLFPFQYTVNVNNNKDNKSISPYHIDYLSSLPPQIQSALDSKLNNKELFNQFKIINQINNINTNNNNNNNNNSTTIFNVFDREYREEYNRQTLMQILSTIGCINSINNSTHSSVRYNPLTDELLLLIQSYTPNNRKSVTKDWNQFLSPNYTLNQFINCNTAIQRSKPSIIYNFSNSNYSGKLSIQYRVSYPADCSLLGQLLQQSGDSMTCKCFIEKDQNSFNIELIKFKNRKYNNNRKNITAAANNDNNNNGNSTAAPITTTELIPAAAPAAAAGRLESKSPSGSKKKLSKSERAAEEAAAAAAALLAQSEAEQRQRELLAKAAADAAAELEDYETVLQTVFTGKFTDHSRLTITGTNNSTLQIAHTAVNGLLIELYGDNSIKQSYPDSQFNTNTSITQYSLSTVTEQYRTIQSSGTVKRVLSTGTIQLLFGNGTTAELTSNSNQWKYIDHNGAITYQSVDSNTTINTDNTSSIEVSKQYDFSSGSTVYIRSDNLCFIQYSNGSTLAQHSDGTRIYTDITTNTTDNSPIIIITVECLNYSPIIFTHTASYQLQQQQNQSIISEVKLTKSIDINISIHDNTVITRNGLTGTIIINKPDQNQFIVNTQGQLVYIPNTVAFKNLHKDLFNGIINSITVSTNLYWINLNHTAVSAGSIKFTDIEDNIFQYYLDGEMNCILGRDRSISINNNNSSSIIPNQYYPAPNPAISPRLIVIRSNLSGYELLDNDAVNKYYQLIQQNKSLGIISLPAESINNNNNNSNDNQQVSLKFLQPLKSPNYYTKIPIIPNILKVAPNLLINNYNNSNTTAIKSPPKYLIYRELIHTTPIPNKYRLLIQKQKQLLTESINNTINTASTNNSNNTVDTESNNTIQQELSAEIELIRSKYNEQQLLLSESTNQHNREFLTSTVPNIIGSELPAGAIESIQKHSVSTSANNLPNTESPAVTEYIQLTAEKKPNKYFKSKSAAAAAANNNNNSKDNTTLSLFDRRLTAFINYLVDNNNNTNESLNLLCNSILTAINFLSRFLNSPYSIQLRTINIDSVLLYSSLNSNQQSNTILIQLLQLLGFQRDQLVKQYILVIQDSDYSQRINQLKDRIKSIAPESKPKEINNLINNTNTNTISNNNNSIEEKEDSIDSSPELAIHSTIDINNNNPTIDSDDAAVDADNEAEIDEYLIGNGNAAGDNADTESIPDTADYIPYDSVLAELTDKERSQRLSKSKTYQKQIERENRLRSLPTTVTNGGHHARHGASFKQKFNQPVNTYPIVAALDRPIFQHNPIELNVAGDPRTSNVILPTHLTAAAQSQPNLQYLSSELQSGQSRPTVKTTSTVRQTLHSQTAGFTEFMLQPAAVEFGILKQGISYRNTLALTNTGSLTGRFTVIQPEPIIDNGNTLKVLYRPGLLAPGLQKRLDVELTTITAGNYSNTITIKTEQSIFQLPVTAQILTESQYKQYKLTQRSSNNSNNSTQRSTTATDSQKPFHNKSTFDLPIQTAGAAFSTGGTLTTPDSDRSSHTGQVRVSPRANKTNNNINVSNPNPTATVTAAAAATTVTAKPSQPTTERPTSASIGRSGRVGSAGRAIIQNEPTSTATATAASVNPGNISARSEQSTLSAASSSKSVKLKRSELLAAAANNPTINNSSASVVDTSNAWL